jgi:hypothetical protein
MNFFILGDSWGVGEWSVSKNGRYTSVPDTGLDFYLSKMGHNVRNISAGSAGNFGQLRHAYWTLKESSNYDYIIWFHTESMRDIQEIIIDDPIDASIQFPNFEMSLDFNKSLHYMNIQNYKYAQAITDEYNIPFIAIGGQSPLDPVINNYSFARYKISSWLTELLNLEFDSPANTFFSWDKIKKILDHYKINEKDFVIANYDDLCQSDIIIELAKKSNLFPDNCHPSRLAFEALSYRIQNLIVK